MRMSFSSVPASWSKSGPAAAGESCTISLRSSITKPLLLVLIIGQGMLNITTGRMLFSRMKVRSYKPTRPNSKSYGRRSLILLVERVVEVTVPISAKAVLDPSKSDCASWTVARINAPGSAELNPKTASYSSSRSAANSLSHCLFHSFYADTNVIALSGGCQRP